MFEVYMDDMIIKTKEEFDHMTHLKEVFREVCKYKMRLNLEKCMFSVKARKLLGFYLIERGLK